MPALSSSRAPLGASRPARPSLVALVALAVLVPAPLQAQTPAPDRRPTLVALDFRNNSFGPGAADWNGLRAGIADALNGVIATNPRVVAVTRDELQTILREVNMNQDSQVVDAASAVREGKIRGVHYMITGGYAVDTRGRLSITARAFSTETSVTVGSSVVTVEGKADDAFELVRELGDRLNDRLQLDTIAVRTAGGAVEPAAPVGQVASDTGAPVAAPRAAVRKPLETEPTLPDAGLAPRRAGGRQGKALDLYGRALAAERRDTTAAVELYTRAIAEVPGGFARASARLAKLGRGAAKP
jgi:hypothetical protein